MTQKSCLLMMCFRSSLGIQMRSFLILYNMESLFLLLLSFKGGQPRVSMFFLEFPCSRKWFPVTNLAALLLTLSSCPICPVRYGSHAVHPYSSSGLTSAKQHCSLTLGGHLKKLRSRKDNMKCALRQTLSHWSFQLSFASIVTPRYLTELKIWRVTP